MFPDINGLTLIVGKISFILGALIYTVFALVVVKQVSMMSKNVNDKFNDVLKIFSYLHLIFSLGLIILTVIFL